LQQRRKNAPSTDGLPVMVFLSCTLLAQVPRGCTPSAVGTQFADVTGDHKASAIAINLSGITVRRPGEKHFERREEWSNGAYFGTDVSNRCHRGKPIRHHGPSLERQAV
jgi:hypothetical protein